MSMATTLAGFAKAAFRGVFRKLKRLKSQGIPLPHVHRRVAYTVDDVCVVSLSGTVSEINAMLRETGKALVLFVDDGATYDDTYVEEVARVLSDDKTLGMASGLVLAHNGKPLANEIDISEAKVIKHDASRKFGESVILPYGGMYRMSVIRENGLSFDEDLVYCRDELFALRYMQVAPKNARVNRCKYRTAKILDETGPKTPQSNDKRWYLDSALVLLGKLMTSSGELSHIAQYGLLYLTIPRFKSNQGGLLKMAFDSPEEREAYLTQVGEVMRHMDDDVLFCRAKAVSWERYKKIYLAQLRNPDKPLEFEVKRSMSNPVSGKNGVNLHVTDARLYLKGSTSNADLCHMSEQHTIVTTLKYAEDDAGRKGLDIRFRLARCFPIGSYRFVFLSECNGETREYPAVWETPVAGIVTFFDCYACRQDTFHAFVPLGEGSASQVISLVAEFDGYRVEKAIEFSKSSWSCKLKTDDEYGYWYFDGHIAQSTGKSITVRPASPEDRVAAETRYQEHLQSRADEAAAKAERQPGNRKLASDSEVASRIAELRRAYWETLPEFEGRTIWTYNDKSYKAGDNAEYAMRYAAAQYDGIEKVYFINPAAKDSRRLKEEGYTVLDPSTIEGKLYALHADIVHMTHVPAFLKLGLGPSLITYFRDLLDAKVIRMYHGYPITTSASYAQISDDCAGVVIGSEYERTLYTSRDNGYAAEQVIDSGMPRYDDLVDDSRRQILFAPTWRPSLTGKSLGGGVAAYNPRFKDSEYYKLYNQVMNDRRVLDAARANGYKIKMFLHPTLSAQTVDFESNDVVEALSCTEDIDYVTIMRQSDLMVTDFSSVQYDFAYMRKPVVYYHDPVLPYWRVVDFDYASIGFGEICTNADELALTLVDYMNNDCRMKDKYIKRVQEFFVHDDRLAGKRLYEADIAIQAAGASTVRLVPGDIGDSSGL